MSGLINWRPASNSSVINLKLKRVHGNHLKEEEAGWTLEMVAQIKSLPSLEMEFWSSSL